MKFQRFFQVVLLLAAVDCLVYGLWASLRPEGVFEWLQCGTHKAISWKLFKAQIESADEVLLWRTVGVLILAHAVLVVLAGWRPRSLVSLVWVPLIGRGLMLGLWLWLLGSDRVEMARLPLWVLAGHEVAVLVLFGVVLTWFGFNREPIVQSSPRAPEARG
jgi:hypothetical protein